MRRHILYYMVLLGYTLGIHRGCLALWVDDRPEPERVFACRVETLPDPDQELLEQGIHAESIPELIHFLEDYLS